MKIILLLSIFISSNIFAGTQLGTVDYITVRASDGLIYFTLKGGEQAGKPSCATLGYWMIKDENSNAGKLQYSMVLSAHASGKVLQVTGMNTCSRWRDGEDVNSMKIQN
jgi:hypothetical protein